MARTESSAGGAAIWADRVRRGMRYASPHEVRRRVQYASRRVRARLVRPTYRSAVGIVYHCCVQRTGSQWLRHVLADPRVYRHSGLRQGHPAELRPDAPWTGALVRDSYPYEFPTGSIVSPLYIDRAAFDTIPKPETYRAFFVARDPRDVVVSWYFSTRYSHSTRKGRTELAEARRILDQLPEPEGLQFAIRRLHDGGLFAALGSWVDAGEDESVLVVRYEDLTGPDQLASFDKLFAHCDVRFSPAVLVDLLADHSFERLAGRERGEENRFSHLRKGVAGDWREHFDAAVTAEFRRVTGDLVERLGYGP